MTNIERMYQELIANESNGDDPLSIARKKYEYDSPSRMNFDPDDIETISTSKENYERDKKKNNAIENRGKPTQFNESPIEESVHFKRYTTRREHKYTETEMAKIRESCRTTIVHDYGERDIYHLSDEERSKNDMLAELGIKLRGLKRIYRKVDEYILAMRVVVEAWELLEKTNYIHTSDEFFKMVAEGHIVSSRIIMPKLKKKDLYNQEMIIKYISNPELDPSDLVPETFKVDPYSDDFYQDYSEDEEYLMHYQQFIDEHKDEYTEENGKDEYELNYDADSYARDQLKLDEMEKLLSEEEVQYIIDHADNPASIRVTPIKRRYINGYDDRNTFMAKKKKKKFKKKERRYVDSLHDLLIKIQTDPDIRKRNDDIYNESAVLTHNMFDVDKEQKDPLDDMFYDGSWTDENGLLLFDLATKEELMKERVPGNKYITFAEQQTQLFLRTLESNGINTRELSIQLSATSEDIQQKITKKEIKDNEKLETKTLGRLIKINNDPKFKKIVAKAEKALNEQSETNL